MSGNLDHDAPRTIEDPAVVREIHAYQAALEAGTRPDRAAVLARFPDLADELAACLEGLEFVSSVAPRLRDAGGADGEAALLGPQAPIGDFRIRREVGRGGMAVVYEAEQISLGRRVALKVLPFASVMDARQLQRFKNEAQAAAHLHHSHIVPVHSIGCERGVHYYAMQYIEGMSVAQMIEELRAIARRDKPKESSSAAVRAFTGGSGARTEAYCKAVARLGIQAAEALDHAHQQGVVHRDIKPANLLVDAMGHLWITDFGLASFTSQPGLTMTGDIVGTVRYMSPEQALAKRVPIDHRTDVYSLGVTLYELLTLEIAFPGDDPHKVIQEIAFRNPAPARMLNPAVPPELETILMKAMAKYPAERFATAQEMADDLARYLANEPIRARRPTLVQRAGKWARRHRPAVAAAVLALCATTVASAVGAFRIAREQARTERAYEAEARQRMRAESNLTLALDALDKVYLAEAEVMPTLRPGLARDMLEKGLDFYERFGQENGESPDLARDTGRAWVRAALIYRKLGQRDEADRALDSAVACLREAIGKRPEWALAHRNIGNALLEKGQVDDAISEFREAIRLDPGFGAAHLSLGRAYCDYKHHFDEAIACFRQAIRLEPDEAIARHNLGVALAHKGQVSEAIAAWREAIRLNPDLALARWALGTSLRGKGELDAAIAEYRQGIRLEPSASAWNALGSVLAERDLHDDAIAAFREAIRLDPQDGATHNNLGLALMKRGFLDDAIAEFRDAIRLAPPDLARVYHNLGSAFRQQGRLDEAIAAYRDAIRLNQDLAETHCALGIALRGRGDPDAAIAEYREAIRLDPDFVAAHHNLGAVLCDVKHDYDGAIAEFRKAIRLAPSSATCHACLGTALWHKGLLEDAIAAYRDAIRLDPGLAGAHLALGSALQAKSQPDDAINELREAIRLDRDCAPAYCNLGALLCDVKHDYDGAILAFREAVRLAPGMALVRYNFGNALRGKGLLDDAIAQYREAIRLAPDPRAQKNLARLLATCEDERLRDPEEAVELAKSAANLAPRDGAVFNTLGVAQYRAGNFKEALDALEQSMRLRSGGDVKDYLFVAMAKWRLGERDEALAYHEKALAWMKEHASEDPELKRFAAEAAELLGAKKND